MATITIIGNSGKKAELRYTQSGKAFVRFTVMENRRRRNAKGEWENGDTSFFNCVAWEQLAENVAAAINDFGSIRLVVTGRMEQQHWKDKETGQDRSGFEVTAEDVAMSLRWVTLTGFEKTASGGRSQVPPPDHYEDQYHRQAPPSGPSDGDPGPDESRSYNPDEEPF